MIPPNVLQAESKKTTRRRFLKELAVAGAALGGASVLSRRAFGASSVGRKRPPNVVLFLSDDHGKRDTGCYGNDVIRTPSIDRLAEEGMRFDRGFAVTATCVPARASMFTGLGPHRHGAHVNHGFVRPGLATLPGYLGALGYCVLLAGRRTSARSGPFHSNTLKRRATGRPLSPVRTAT